MDNSPVRIFRIVGLVWLAAMVVGGISAVTCPASGWTPEIVGSKEGPSGFCQPKKARSLLAPLRRLPAVLGVPESGRLSVGGRSLEVDLLPGSRILFGGEIGAVLSSRREMSLDWRVDGRLIEVDRHGRQVGSARQRRWSMSKVGQDSARTLSFRVGAKPALYRADFTFRNALGVRLGHFAEYFRVVRREVKVDLELNAQTYAAGGQLVMRLKNLGTTWIFYGDEVRIERWTDGGWVKDPSTPNGGSLEGLGLAGGATGECERVHLGDTSGVFRVSKSYSPANSGREATATAEYVIAP